MDEIEERLVERVLAALLREDHLGLHTRGHRDGDRWVVALPDGRRAEFGCAPDGFLADHAATALAVDGRPVGTLAGRARRAGAGPGRRRGRRGVGGLRRRVRRRPRHRPRSGAGRSARARARDSPGCCATTRSRPCTSIPCTRRAGPGRASTRRPAGRTRRSTPARSRCAGGSCRGRAADLPGPGGRSARVVGGRARRPCSPYRYIRSRRPMAQRADGGADPVHAHRRAPRRPGRARQGAAPDRDAGQAQPPHDQAGHPRRRCRRCTSCWPRCSTASRSWRRPCCSPTNGASWRAPTSTSPRWSGSCPPTSPAIGWCRSPRCPSAIPRTRHHRARRARR